ncbi:pyrroline-5-carboxylate reductase [Pseudomarimonas arenosa]|uniref:Pyrroline-5-carboxylate reductase n=1 Tax=Pseudomarimonas arenosa TaxID=2774145 RepID=A0AAW3ZKX8_9GAMM|nr:pyrroline-5-carboxylate reductase [Pseudomarimonas arenosa]MBD8525580.1 pyrroline-5-carboxylate reductase [Pseudomarimonas arenosa]
MTQPAPTLCFIGGGNMARCLIGGLRQRGTPGHQIRVAEPMAAAREALQTEFDVACFESNRQAAEQADCVVLAVKPQIMHTVCQELHGHSGRPLWVSIAAGITSTQLDTWLGGDQRIVRCMPNTPALLGVGATGLVANVACHEADRALAERILSAVGIAVWIAQEAQMDAVTALSGSGPAYSFLLAEAMQAAALRQGLDAEAARRLTYQTLLGAARMLSESAEPADQLRKRVTSPGGTTQAAIETLQGGGFEALIDRAIAAATRRGAELAAAAGN